MKQKTVLITGSSGLIGSEAVRYFDARGWRVIGIDNNSRKEFFGPEGDTATNRGRLCQGGNVLGLDVDIRDLAAVEWVFRIDKYDLIIHCAAQPSHDLAATMPLRDFETNAVGTLYLLESARQHCPESPFIFMSTNKVYGDAPNEIPMMERPTRWDYADPKHYDGIDESCRIDQSMHSLFGVSKASADLLAQEYGRYFGMPVGIFRGGCLTGPQHAGVQLHGFLSYLVKTVCLGGPYRILGYRGKQVRDNIHAYDVVTAMEQFYLNPKKGEVYNIGGGRQNSASIIEAIEMVERFSGRELQWVYEDSPRKGDHVCYISDTRKFRTDYPDWSVTRSLEDIIREMVEVHRVVAA